MLVLHRVIRERLRRWETAPSTLIRNVALV
jgi:hypothetical protein